MVLAQQVKWVLNFEQSRESVRPIRNWTANDSLFDPFILSRLERTSDHHTLMGNTRARLPQHIPHNGLLMRGKLIFAHET